MSKKAIRGTIIAAICSAGIAFVSAPTFAANSGNIDFSTEILPSTTITIPNAPVGVNITPSSAGAFGSTSFNVTVSTNQPGYTLSMTTNSTRLTSTTVDPETNEYFTIPTLDFVSGGYTQSTFTRNRWGISIDGGNYNAVAASQQLKDTSVATNADTTTIGVGANLDLLTASGSYSTTIEFTVVPKIMMSAIQDITTATCPTSPTLVYDNRDGTEYHIQKLGDGKCWMLDNLALDLANSTVLNNVTAANTNASATSLNYLKNGGGTTSDQYAITGVTNWTSYDNSYSVPSIVITDKDVVPNNAPTNGAGYNKIGGYYNFCTASAGSYCYGDGTSEGASSGDATEDICPKNWRMPTGNTSGEYAALAKVIYGSTGNTSDATATANYRSALSLPLSGSFYDGSAGFRGTSGDFWSSTRYNDRSMYLLGIVSNNLYPSSYNYRFFNYSIRCLAGV